ncbi:MAG: hypothetical protein V4649_10890 [Bacteroidota bacterium]
MSKARRTFFAGTIVSTLSLFVVLLVLTGCPKPHPNPIYGTVTAKVDGQQYNGVINSTGEEETHGIRTFFFMSNSDKHRYISISIKNYHGAGTYAAGPNAPQLPGGYAEPMYNDSTDTYFADKGAVIVTSANAKDVQGTFHFITSNGTNISDGSFVITMP